MSNEETSNEETVNSAQVNTNLPSDLFDNVVFWNIDTDGQNWNRFDATMEEAKNILAERGSVCIQLKLLVNDCDDAFLSLLLDNAADRAIENIERDESMVDVTVISEPIETCNSNANKNFMLCLYLDKNEHIVN